MSRTAIGSYTFSTIASFNINTGAAPQGGVVLDSSGNIYGTTSLGGSANLGTVFEIGAGTNTISTLTEFTGTNGNSPQGSLAIDAARNVYGFTQFGGATNLGTIFQVSATSHALGTVVSFDASNRDSAVAYPYNSPFAAPALGAGGNIYGTATDTNVNAGNGPLAYVYQISSGSNTITRTANTDFSGYPQSGLASDSLGNYYFSSSGAIYEFSPATPYPQVIYNPNTGNIPSPNSELTLDRAGNIYGTNTTGICEILAGSQTAVTLAPLTGATGAALAIDPAGDLFGTTYNSSAGTVFELKAGSNAITTLATFPFAVGGYPMMISGVKMDPAGNLYGTSENGGTGGRGFVFEVSPTPSTAINNVFTTGSNWNNAANWNTSAVPTSSANAVFANSGNTSIGFSSASVANDLHVAAGSVNFNLAGQTLLLSGGLSVADNASESANLTITGGYLSSGSSGFRFGYSYVGDANGSSGSMTLDGANWSNNASHLAIGGSGGGTLTLKNNAGLDLFNGNLELGAFDGGAGTVNVQSGAHITTLKQFYVGEAGSGHLSITGASQVLSNDGIIGGDVGASPSDVTITGVGSNWTCQGSLYVGGYHIAGSAGSLNVSNGGTVNVNGTLKLWDSAGTSVNLANGGTITAGNLELSYDQSAIVTNLAGFNWTGGTLSITNSDVFVQSSFKSLGPAITLNSGMKLQLTNNTLYVGVDNYLNATATNTSVTVNPGAELEAENIQVGNYYTSDTCVFSVNGGVVNVQNLSTFSYDLPAGGGSSNVISLTNGAMVNVVNCNLGDAGGGAATVAILNISNGTVLNCDNASVNFGYPLPSAITVAGTNSVWNVSNNLVLSNFYAGSLPGLLISGGAEVKVGGNLNISSGSGYGDPSLIVVSSGGVLNVSGTINVTVGGSQKEILLSSGGTIIAAAIANPSGVGFNWSGGTLDITGSDGFSFDLSSSGLGSSVVMGDGYTFAATTETISSSLTQNDGSRNTTGSVTINRTGVYTINGGSLTTGDIAFADQANMNQYGGTVTCLPQNSSGSVYIDDSYDDRYQQKTSYNLFGGALVSANEVIGDLQSGSFAQSGGTNSTGILSIAASSSATHCGYDLVGGTANVTAGLFVGGSANGPGGAGTLAVTGGVITVTGGLTVFDTSSTLSISGTGIVNTDSTTIYSSGSSIGTGGSFDVGSGGLTFAGTDSPGINLSGGTLTLTGSLIFNGGGGTATLSGSGTLDLGGAVRTFNISHGNNAVDMSISALITDGTFIKTGSGTLELSGTNTDNLSGPVEISTGTILLTNPDALYGAALIVDTAGTLNVPASGADIGSLHGSGSVVLAGGTLLTGIDNSSTTFSGTLSGPGSLQLFSNGTLTLSSANTYGGYTFIEAGTLRVASINAIPPESDVILDTTGTLDVNGYNIGIGSLSGAGNVTLGSGTLTVGLSDADSTFSGSISGTGGLVKQGAGTMTLDNPTLTFTGGFNVAAGTVVAGGTTNFSGGLILTASGPVYGSFQADSDGEFGNTNNSIGIYGGVLIAAGTFASPRVFVLGDQTGNGQGYIYVDADDTLTLTGEITGLAGLVKQGPGTLIIGGDAQTSGTSQTGVETLNYKGKTTVLGGTLQLGTGVQLPSSSVVGVAPGATLDLGGQSRTIAALQDITAGGGSGTVSIGSAMLTTGSLGASTIFSGNIVGSSGGSIAFSGAGSLTLAGPLTGFTGGVNVTQGRLILTNPSNTFTGGATASGGELQMNNDGALGTSTNAVNLSSGGILEVTASFATARNIAVSSGGGTIAIAAGSMLTSSGLISGSAPLTVSGTTLIPGSTGSGMLSLTSSEPFAGALTVDGDVLPGQTGGVTLALSGSARMVAISSLTLVRQAEILLNDSSQITSGRLGSATALDLADGTLAIDGPTSGIASETLGSLTVTAGTLSSIDLIDGNAGSVDLTFASYTRSPGGLVDLNFSSSSDRIFFDSLPAGIIPDQTPIPGLILNEGGLTGHAEYDPTQGIIFFGTPTQSTSGGTGNSGTNSIPEPSALPIAVMGMAALATRRRRLHARLIYSPVSVLIRIVSPVTMKPGTRVVNPVSSVASFN